MIGNAIQYASIPCLFAMGNTISGERNQRTLGLILVSPAKRLPLYLGRALPVTLNGMLVSVVAFAIGATILHVHVLLSAIAPLALVILVNSFSCTGLGFVNGGLSLRVRETAVTSNVIFGFLLVFCGANVPLHDLPGWMSTIAQGLPLTHGIEAARKLAAGASLGSVGGLVLAELLIGSIYLLVGYSVVRFFEWQSRVHATLERI